MRKAVSFTVDRELLAEIAASKGTQSTSDRVNDLLKRALEVERREKLEREAAEFFRTEPPQSRRERLSFQKASSRIFRD